MAGTLVKRAMLKIAAEDGDTAARIDRIAAKAEELGRLHPELEPRINTAAASAKLAVLKEELKAAGDEAAVAGDEMQAAGDKAVVAGEKSESAFSERAWEGAKLAILGVGAALGYGVYKAAGFDQAILHLHTQAGVSVGMMNTLGAGVLRLAGQVGEDPDSLAEAAYHVASNMASMGAKSTQMLNAVRVAAQGARVGGADLVDVTNALGAAIASKIPGVQNYTQAMGMLNATVGAGDMTMQDLSEAFGTGFLANVKQYGTTLKDVGAILATFGDNNIRGAHAGTQLRMSVQSLAVQASTAAPYLKQLGLQVGELGKYQAIHGTVATINLLVDRLKAAGIARNMWGNEITQLFGKKAGAGIAVLVGEADRMNSKFHVLAQGAHDFGKEWDAQSKTAAQQFADLKDGAEALVISLGQKLLPVALTITHWLASFVNGLERGSAGATVIAGVIGTVLAGVALLKLEEGLGGAVEGFESLWRAGGRAVSFVGQMAARLGLFTAATEEATAATEAGTVATEGAAVATTELDGAMDANPIGLVVLAIAALVVGLVELYKHVRFVRVAVADVGHFFGWAWHQATVAAGDAIRWFEGGPLKSIRAGIGDFKHWWDQNHAEIMKIATAAWAVIRTNVLTAWGLIKTTIGVGLIALRTAWDVAWAVFSGTVKIAWAVISTVIGTTIRVIGDVISAVLDVIQGKWGAANRALMDAASAAWHGIWHIIVSITSGFGHMLYSAGQAIVNGLIGGIKSAASGLFSTISGLARNVSGAFSSVLHIFSPSRVFFGHGENMILGAVLGAESMRGRLLASIQSIALDAADAFTPRGGRALAAGAYGGGRVVVEIDLRGGDSAFMTWLKNQIRVRGGDPSVVGR